MQMVINSMAVHTSGNKNNPAIIFVHGFPFDSWMWHKQVQRFRKEFYCVTYDIRGLGESYVGDGQYTMEAYVSDLMSIIDHLGIEKPILCGLSMGGYLALRATEKFQERFSGLVLLDTKADADDDKGKLVRANKINQINIDGLEAFVDGFVPPLFAEEAEKDYKKLFYETIHRCKQNNPLGVKGALIAMLSRTSTVKFLKKIKIPTLVISGSQDKLTPPVKMRDISEKIPNSEFAIVPRAGHLSPLENAPFVNDVIEGFIKRRVLIK